MLQCSSFCEIIRKMKSTVVLFFITSCVTLALAHNGNTSFDPDTGLSLFQLLDKYKYPLENHTTITEDGYILTVHRISNGKNNSKIGPPVLLMHGILCGSHDWINNGPNWSLGLILADLGFDVWMGNQRGNTYSRHHTTLDPVKDAAKFFDFSFHEIGFYDIPAMIDYVLNVTDQSKLHYVGHSQGTTAFFVMASMRPEYNDKVYEMIALAPVAYINITSPLMTLAVKYKLLIELTFGVLGWHEIAPHADAYLPLIETICTKNMSWCVDFFSVLCGADPGELDSSKFYVYSTNDPAGASVKQLLHYLQELQSGYFRQYDYGIFGNHKHYGQWSPPSYNVSKISCPTHLFYADHDSVSNWKNVEELAVQLPDVYRHMIVNYSHADFIWGIHAPEYVYNDVINIFNNVTEESPKSDRYIMQSHPLNWSNKETN